MLLQLSQFFALCPPVHPATQLPQDIPTPLFMSMGHTRKFFGYSISFTVHPHGYSVTTYLYILFPYLFTHCPYAHLPSGNHQNAPRIHDSVTDLVSLICFLNSIVDKICIYCHFIVPSFDLLFLR